jgi:hypothetical protein
LHDDVDGRGNVRPGDVRCSRRSSLDCCQPGQMPNPTPSAPQVLTVRPVRASGRMLPHKLAFARVSVTKPIPDHFRYCSWRECRFSQRPSFSPSLAEHPSSLRSLVLIVVVISTLNV